MMRSTEEIYQALKQDFFLQSGMALKEGGDMALRLRAVAAEIFSLEAQCDFMARQAFPQTASGGYLDLHAQVRALQRRQAAKAEGVLRFYASQPAATELTVPEGCQCLDAGGRVFVTTQAGSIPAGGSFCQLSARAAVAGEEGNAAAGSIVFMRLPPAGIDRVENPEPFTGGSAAEDDGSLRRRVTDSYRRLPNGANAAWYEALVQGVAGVEKVVVLPRARGRGTVDIVFSAEGGLPSQELVEQVGQLVQEHREICVDVEVRAPQALSVDVQAVIKPAGGWESPQVISAVEAALAEYFSGKRLGEGLYAAALLALIMGVEGVENCSLVLPDRDYEAETTTLPVAGSISISGEA